MNETLTERADLRRHEESDNLKKVARLVKNALANVINIYEHTNDYRARAAIDSLHEAETVIDKVELDIIKEILEKRG